MKKCSNPDHPHCTYWVMPGETTCANGHSQAAAAASSFDLISSVRAGRSAERRTVPAVASTVYPPMLPLASRPFLHISGFDPRAAGGRQAIKIELRGMPSDSASTISMQLQSALIADGASRHTFVRTLRGTWRPVFAEFSSRGKEHGQYQIDVALCSEADGKVNHRWACTLMILVPRADATLTDIQQTFLSTHKNVRVVADDASIARVHAQSVGRLDIDVSARNASIAHLNLDAAGGKVDMGFTTIAWDEDLIEIDLPPQLEAHPFPSQAACVVNAAPEAGAQRQTRLFALGECVLGRFEQYDPEADALLMHFCEDGQDRNGLTRRLSARHAVIRRGHHGMELEDVSRYGVLLDGVWPGKNKPVPLRLGMRIELTASIKGVVTLQVSALLPNGVILHRIDAGARAECFYFLEPERRPVFPLGPIAALPHGAVMPVLFHQAGGFWHLDPVSGKETPLCPTTSLDKLAQFPAYTRFTGEPYPESWIIRTANGQLRGGVLARDMHTA